MSSESRTADPDHTAGSGSTEAHDVFSQEEYDGVVSKAPGSSSGAVSASKKKQSGRPKNQTKLTGSSKKVSKGAKQGSLLGFFTNAGRPNQTNTASSKAGGDASSKSKDPVSTKRARVVDSDSEEDDVVGPGPRKRQAVSGRSPTKESPAKDTAALAFISQESIGSPFSATHAEADGDTAGEGAGRETASPGENANPGAGGEAKEDGGGSEHDPGDSDGDDPGAAHSAEEARTGQSSGKAAIPGKEYHPVKAVEGLWRQGQPVPFRALTQVFSSIEQISGRLEMQKLLCNFFRSVIALTPEDLLPCVYICSNRLAPAYKGVELGIGDSILIKAIAEVSGRNAQRVKSDLQEKGDLGQVAEASQLKQRTIFPPPPLTLRSVFDKLHGIANLSGNRVQEEKVRQIKSLLVPASAEHAEPRFVIRLLQGKLRMGLAERTVLVALAHAVSLTPAHQTRALPDGPDAAPLLPEAGGDEGTFAASLDTRFQRGKNKKKSKPDLESAVEQLKQVYSELPSYDELIPRLLEGGIARAQQMCQLTPGVPISPMLAKPTKGISEVLNRLKDRAFTCEWKYDGERAQIHRLPDGTVRIFSRNSEETTAKYPDLAAMLPGALREGTDTLVLDGEVIAYDREKKHLLPFQVLSTRSRKDVSVDNVKVQVIYAAFDLLYLNGESLVRRPLRERRNMLHASFQPQEGRFQFAVASDSQDTDDLVAFLDDAVKGQCEGLMVKTLDADASYEPSKRSLNWLKVKKDYLEGVGDTFDLVPVGAWYGKGKRTGRFGSFLMACYNEDEDEFQTVSKVGTGFSDEDLQSLYDYFHKNECIVREKPVNVAAVSDTRVTPDVWLEPSVVWELKAADLSISPAHMAAIGEVDESKGIALRFPRFSHVREDKSVEQATSAHQVAQMYRDQPSVGSGGGGGGAAGDMEDDD